MKIFHETRFSFSLSLVTSFPLFLIFVAIIQSVDCFHIQFAKTFSLTKFTFDATLHSHCWSISIWKGIFRIVHNRINIIFLVLCCTGAAFMKVSSFSRLDVIPIDDNVLVSVSSRLFVPESYCLKMKKGFMRNLILKHM